MRRRDFLRSSALAAAALGTGRAIKPAFAAPAVVARTKELIVASPWPQSASGYSDLAFGFTRRLEQACGGRIKCQFIMRPGGSIDVLNGGGADLHIGLEHGNVPHHAAFSYFAGLPGALGLQAEEFSEWLASGDGQTLWDECSAPFGIKSLMIAHTATGGGLWSRSELPAISGKRIASQGLARDVLKGLGAATADAGLNETSGALASGALEAFELAHIIEALPSGSFGTAKYSVMPGITHRGSTLAVSFGHELWQGFDYQTQAQIIGVAAHYNRAMTSELRENDSIIRRLLNEMRHVEFMPAITALETEIERVAEAVVAEIAARDALSRRINAAYMTKYSGLKSVRHPAGIA